jgi:tripartite-type tricarboxylate transporter receptor subunit TctC
MQHALRPALLIAFAAACYPPQGWAADDAAKTYPNRPVRLIIAQTTGSSVDTLSRVLAAKLGEALGQQIVADNRGGAGGTIGAEIAAHAAPDGYTLLATSTGVQVISPQIYKKLNYQPVKDFAQISLFAVTQNVLVMNPGLPLNSVKELIAYAKANPGKLNFANVGTSTLGYLLSLQLKALTGTQMLDVSYKGSSQIYPDLMSNQVSVFLDNPGASTPLVNSGRLKAYGVTTPTPSMPGVPLFTDVGKSVGLGSFDSSFWYGLVAPAGTPKAIVDRIQAETRKYVQSAEGRKEFATRSLEPVGDTPEQFSAAIQKDVERFTALVKQLNIQPQ